MNLVATSSEHYATSTFTFGGGEQQLSGSPTAVSGFLLTAPTSTNAVSSPIYWGLSVPSNEPTGTYSGTVTFVSLFYDSGGRLSPGRPSRYWYNLNMRRSNGFVFAVMVSATFVAGFLFINQTIFGATSTSLTSQVIVGIATPTVTSVSVNHGNAITLTANTTTNVDVDATINDANSCSEITGGSTTIVLYRSGVSSSSCLTGTGTSIANVNCYGLSAFTASSTCSAGTLNTTTTFSVQYFAQATDASSSFNGQTWMATVLFKTVDNTKGTGDSSPGQTLNTTLALNVTTSTINYGILQANSNSGSTDQVVTSTNAGNASTSLQLYALQTLISGANVIPTTSQAFSTSTFTYAGTSTALTGSAVTVNGLLLTTPTTTTNVAQPTFWGIAIPNNQATGTYTGTNVFQALFHS